MDWGKEEGGDVNPFYSVSICCLAHECIDLIFTFKVRRWLNEKLDSIWTVNAHGRDLRFPHPREPN